jgi:indolepyruvate ferredoxin oxidoreductase, beta subunit
MDMNSVTNVVLAGLGGQGVLKASDILADAALRHGYEVKKSEIHGMSQRGGSVTSDVRFGEHVWSPMVPLGEADFLVVLASDQLEPNRHYLRPTGCLITPESIDTSRIANRKTLNVAILGYLSQFLPLAENQWAAAIRANLAEKLHEMNLLAFRLGRECHARQKSCVEGQ